MAADWVVGSGVVGDWGIGSGVVNLGIGSGVGDWGIMADTV